MKSVSGLGVGVLVALFGIESADATDRFVTLDEAKHLAEAAVPARAHKLPGFEIDHDRDSSHFYFFEALWSGLPSGGSAHIQFVAIDKETADVWNPVMDCEKLETVAISHLQVNIRKRLHMAASEYAARRRSCPLELDEIDGGI